MKLLMQLMQYDGDINYNNNVTKCDKSERECVWCYHEFFAYQYK